MPLIIPNRNNTTYGMYPYVVGGFNLIAGVIDSEPIVPVASFTYAADGLEVTFTDTSTSATSWSWDFGDSSPADTTQNPAHTYAGHGTYNVNLTINGGADSDTQPVSVNTAFHAAVIAAGATYFFDHQELSGTVADNSGSVGTEGTYYNITLAQTDAAGANDAGLYDSNAAMLSWPTTDFSGKFTLGWLVKREGALHADGGNRLINTSSAVTGGVRLTCDTTSIIARVTTTSGSLSERNVITFLTEGSWVLIFMTFDPDTGTTDVYYSYNGVLYTPVTNTNVTSTIGQQVGSPTFVRSYGYTGLTNGMVGGAFLIKDKLTPTQMTAIAESIWPQPASASFTYASNALEVTFTDTSTGATSWSWDFGDGSPADTTQNPVHTYAGHGTRNVTLTINSGADSDTQPVVVNTAFHEAVLATPNMNRFFDSQESSGSTAVDNGLDAINGTYSASTVAQTTINGTIDGVNSGSLYSSMFVPSLGSVNSFTLGLLVRPNGSPLRASAQLVQFSGTGTGSVVITSNAGQVSCVVTPTGGTASTVTVNAANPILFADTWTALYLRYDHTTGAMLLRYAIDSSLSVPVLSVNHTGSGGGMTLNTNNVFGYLGQTGSTRDAFFFSKSYLSDEQLGVINSAINWP